MPSPSKPSCLNYLTGEKVKSYSPTKGKKPSPLKDVLKVPLTEVLKAHGSAATVKAIDELWPDLPL